MTIAPSGGSSIACQLTGIQYCQHRHCKMSGLSYKWAVFGFTLAELLIAVLILGEIATFTIPKIISAQQNGRYKTEAKQLAGTLSAAYINYVQQNGYSTAIGPQTLTPYLNYASVDTTSTIDDRPGYASGSCAGRTCLRLHTGGILWFGNHTFSGTNTTDAIYFNLDPDASQSVPGSALDLNLYYNGRIVSAGTRTPNTRISGSTYGVESDPTWFSW
jgi:type II secretory pathway pseudopilin PulG